MSENWPTGRSLWGGDVGVTDVSAAWNHLFGEPFDPKKAIATQDCGDATGYLMPGGFVVYDQTYETNHGIYAPPRKAPEGAVWGLRVEPRKDPVVMPVILPEGYELFDEVRRAYQHKNRKGKRHTAKSRSFVRSGDWYGVVYVLSGSERDAEREKHHFWRTTEEAMQDALCDWFDNKNPGNRDNKLRRAVEPWYVPEDRMCARCHVVGRIHPSFLAPKSAIAGKILHASKRIPVMRCGACQDWWGDDLDLWMARREVAARALRYYGEVALDFATKTLCMSEQKGSLSEVIDCLEETW